jgi:hypothetical protein
MSRRTLAAALALGCLPTMSCSRPSEISEQKSDSGEPAAPAKPAGPAFGRLSVEPNTGSGAQQVFTVRLSRSPGLSMPELIGLLINDRLTGANACYMFRQLSTKDSLLVNDSGVGSKPLGSRASLGNTQCTVLLDKAESTISDTEVTVRYHVAFKPEFKGPKKLFVIAQDAAGATGGLEPAGQWIVP